jgi:hypothetical protein
MSKIWTVTVKEDLETGDTILPFPEDMINELGWLDGDILNFSIQDNETIITNKSLQERVKKL